MFRTFKKNLTLAALLLALAAALPLMAGGGFGGGGFGGGGRQNSIDYIRQQVGFDDDEWTVIQPKLQKVIDCQTALHLTTNNRGNFGNNQIANQPDPVLVAQQELSSTLQEPGSLTETISAKLKALRDSRIRARDNLTIAREDLIKILTVRQEALLVNLGYLE